jgi:isochorismate hydrolase
MKKLKRSALLIIDMQKYFLERSSHAYVPSAPAIIPKIIRLIEAYSKNGLPIIFTRHINSRKNAGMMARWWRHLLQEKNLLSELIGDLNPSLGIVIKKSQYDAFHITRLESLLKKKKIRQLVICGVTTNLCCESTARSAFVRGFEVFFITDGTATYNKRLHQASLMNLRYGFANLVTTKEMIRALKWNLKI